MNLTARISRFVESNSPPLLEAGTGYSLATLSTIDDDEHLFRRLTQESRDLGGLTLERQREIAFYLADTNPFAKRIIQMTRDFVVGDAGQWKVKAVNPKVQALLKAHWDDPVNDWVNKLESRVRELALAGEQCYSVRTGADGIVRLGYVDPGFIAAIRRNQDNLEILEEVVLKKQNPADDEKRLRIINYDIAQGRMIGKEGQAGADYADDCFFWKLNAPVNATRGRSDLFAVADGLDMLDRFHFNRMERAALINAFFWECEIKGANEAQLRDYAKKMGPPKPGGVRYTNENTTWTAVTPNLQGQDASAEGLMMQTSILVGSGYPRHWLMGTGDDANRATAYEMGDPPIRALNTRQLFVVRMIYRVFRYQIDEAQAKIPSVLFGVPEDELYSYSLSVPEIQTRDVVKLASALESIGRTIMGGIGLYLSRQTAVGLFAFTASQLGFEINAEEELERLDEEEGQRDEQDIGGLVLPVRQPLPIEAPEEEGVPA